VVVVMAMAMSGSSSGGSWLVPRDVRKVWRDMVTKRHHMW
jgi:hypothetical protein